MDAQLDGLLSRNREYFGNYTRFVILLISTVALTMIMGNSLILNFSIICMSEKKTVTTSNETVLVTFRPIFTKFQENTIISFISVGTLLGTIPVTYFTSNFGMR